MPASAAYSELEPPDVEVEVGFKEVTASWPDKDTSRFEFRISGPDSFHRIGSTDSTQLNLYLGDDLDGSGDTYQIEFRAADGRDRSSWTAPIAVHTRTSEISPRSIRVSAADQSARLSWGANGADEYRYHIWSDGSDHRFVWTSETEAVITGLRNGTTYNISMMSRRGSIYTPWSDRLTVTPNVGLDGSVEILRPKPADDYVDLGNDQLSWLTVVDDRPNLITGISTKTVGPVTSEIDSATLDAGRTVRSGATGVWLSSPSTVAELDYRVYTTATGSSGVVASSVESFRNGTYDLVIDDTIEGRSIKPVGRVGTFR